MSNANLITFHHAQSPLCHLPGDPVDLANRVAATDTVGGALSLLEKGEGGVDNHSGVRS